MERRSWPWRRKSADKTTPVSPSLRPSQPGFSAPQHTLSTSQPQLLPPVLPSKPEDSSTTINVEQETSNSSTENVRAMEAILQWQQAEEKVSILTEKLASAMSDIAEKNEVVKQHSKVAEEAISGWEKVKSEALALKQQLEATLQEKIATEDRVSHLDGALKECVRQVRHVREEQEQRIQEAIMKKSREWDKVRTELEAKQAELARQVLETGAENSAMSKSLQERARAILEVTEAKAKAETEVKVLQVRVESLEREISALKYEIHVLNKELEIRNEEREYSKKSADTLHRQHLENVKKMAKLESDCQRLRALVRKKLPSPAAVAQMRMEVDAFGRESWEGRRRRAPTKAVAMSLDSWQERPQANANKEVQMLTDRLLAMEEETNLLKEVLAKRNNELHAARQMCARTATKLTTVEEQLDHGHIVAKVFSSKLDLQMDGLSTKEPSLASRSEDGFANDDETSCAESWASALIAELAHFKKDKPMASSRQSLDSCNLDNLDDIHETERAAVPSNGVNGAIGDPHSPLLRVKLPHGVVSRNSDLQSAYQMCKDVSSKLLIVEENLKSLKVTNAENEATLSQVQESLCWIYKAHEEVLKLDKVLGEVGIMLSPVDNSIVKFQAETPGSSASECLSSTILEGNHPIREPNVAINNAHAKDLSSANPNIIHSVSSVMCKIVQLIESLAPVLAQHMDLGIGIVHNTTKLEGEPQPPLNVDLQKQMLSLSSLKEKLSQGKIDMMEYLLQLALVLSCLSGLDKCELESALTKLASSNTAEEVEKSVVSNDLKVEAASCSDHVKDPHKATDENQNRDLQEETDSEKLRSDHPGMESVTLVASLQRDLEKVEQEKTAIEQKLGAAEEEIRNIKSKLVETELLVSELQQQLSSVQESKEQVERDLADETASKTDLVTQLQDAKVEMGQLSEKVTSLAAELEEKQTQYKDRVVKCEDLEQQLKEFMKESAVEAAKENELFNSRRTADEDETRSRKEQEVAAAKEKLAECQRTIFVLGKQLNAMTTSDSPNASFGSSMESGLLIDNRIVPTVSNIELAPSATEDMHMNSIRMEMERRKAHSGMPWTRSDRRLLEHDSSNRGYVSSSLDPEVYMPSNRGPSQLHYPAPHFSRHMHHPDHVYKGNGLHSPIQECAERSMFMYSPPDTAMSSPARSPARLVQYAQKRSSGNAVRLNLTKSMNKVASNSSSSAKPTKSGSVSSFGRLFSRNKQHC